jgi:hypothetical protein
VEQPGYGHLRAAQADRERAVDVLKAAFAEGRLDQDEYAERVELVFRSRTYAELAELTADLPIGPLGTLAPPQPSSAGKYLVPAQQPLSTSPAAATALVLGIGAPFSFGFTAPLALILGVIGAFDTLIGRHKGFGMALTAICLGAIGTGILASTLTG